MDFNKYLTNKNVALLGTITFHAILFAIFTHVHLGVNKPDHEMDLVINFIEQKEVEKPVEEEKIEEKQDFAKELEGPITNQASSRSNENTVEDLRKSMKSLEGVRGEETDLFSDKAAARKINTSSKKTKEATDGKGEAKRESKNAFTGRSTINYFLKNRYNDPIKNRTFVVGIDRAKMRLYDVEEEAQKELITEPKEKGIRTKSTMSWDRFKEEKKKSGMDKIVV